MTLNNKIGIFIVILYIIVLFIYTTLTIIDNLTKPYPDVTRVCHAKINGVDIKWHPRLSFALRSSECNENDMYRTGFSLNCKLCQTLKTP